jgi:hypothetical protein
MVHGVEFLCALRATCSVNVILLRSEILTIVLQGKRIDGAYFAMTLFLERINLQRPFFSWHFRGHLL